MDTKLLENIQEQLTHKFGKSVEIYSDSSIGGGCINHASKLETSVGAFFLKWNAHCSSDIFVREAESLAELNSVSNPFVTVPETFASKNVDETPGFLVMEYLESGGGNDSDEKLGRGLATIHKHSNDSFGFYHNNYCGATLQNNNWNNDWIDFFGKQRIWSLIKMIEQERGLSSGELMLYEKLVSKLDQLLPTESKPALIHGDLWSGNYMHTKDNPALIDPASYYADREMEMGIMTMFGGFSQRFWAAYNEIYTLPYEWKERNQLYQLYHILNHYYLFGGGYGSQALAIARLYV